MDNKELKEVGKAIGMNNIEVIDKSNGEFNFSCSMCGQCCKNRDDILLSPYDVFKLSKGLKISSVNFVKKYCDVHLGNTSNLPMVTLKFKEGIGYTFCPFLKYKDKLYKCIVHKYKPSVCALFPLGRLYKSNEANISEIQYIVQPDVCNCDREERHTVKDWLSNFDINDSEQAHIDWNNCVIYLQKAINLYKVFHDKKISKNLQNIIYNGIIGGLYGNINTNNDILKELNLRYEQTKRSIDITVAFYYVIFDIDIKGDGYNPSKSTIEEVDKMIQDFNAEQVRNSL